MIDDELSGGYLVPDVFIYGGTMKVKVNGAGPSALMIRVAAHAIHILASIIMTAGYRLLSISHEVKRKQLVDGEREAQGLFEWSNESREWVINTFYGNNEEEKTAEED